MLRLSALDIEDLAVISAQMQDAVLLAGDMRYDPKRRQFVLLANRYAWDAAQAPQRRRTGLHFDRVLAVKTLNMGGLEKDEVMSLLSVTFAEIEAPGGEVLLSFSGGATVRLIVETDMGSLEALARPGHHIAAVNVDFGAEFFHGHQMHVDRPGADGAAAGKRDAGLAAARQQRSQHPEAGPHLGHQLIGRGGVGDLAGREMHDIARPVLSGALSGHHDVDAVVLKNTL